MATFDLLTPFKQGVKDTLGQVTNVLSQSAQGWQTLADPIDPSTRALVAGQQAPRPYMTLGGVQYDQYGNPLGSGNYSAGGLTTAPQYTSSPAVPAHTNLTGTYANVNGTIYNKQTGQAFSTPDQFFKEAGVNSWDGLKFDTAWRPGQSSAASTATASTYPAPSTNAGYGFGDFGQRMTTQVSPPTEFSTQLPETFTPTQDTTNAEIRQKIQENLDRQNQLFANLGNLATVSPEEQALQGKVAQGEADIYALKGQEAGVYNPDQQPIAMPFLTGQAQNKLLSANLQQSVNQARLAYMQGNRQFAFNAAKDIYNASRQNLLDTLQIYTQTAPQNLGTNYNPNTGMLTAITRNPFTGEVQASPVGNIGAQKSFTSTNIATNPMTGELTFIGTMSDGSVVQQPIGSSISGGAAGSATPGTGNLPQRNNNPLNVTYGSATKQWVDQGLATVNPTADGRQFLKFNSPEAGFQAASDLLFNSGVYSNLTLDQAMKKWSGNGYGAEVYGQIPGNTKISQIPQAQRAGLIQAMATREGYYANTGNSGTAQLPAFIKAALQNASGMQYIDMGKLTSAQEPAAQAYSAQLGIPLLTKEDADKIQEVEATFNSTDAMLSSIENLSSKLITAQSGFGVPGQYLSDKLGALFRSNTDAKVYQDTVKSFSSLLTRAAGEKGTLTDQDVNRIINALPTFTDTVQTAQAKLQQLRNLYSATKSGVYQAYLGQAPQQQAYSGQTSSGLKYQIIQ